MRALLVFLLSLMLAACGSGPDESALQKDVAERLALAVPENTVTLLSVARRGSQSDTKAPEGETRRVLYFDAELKLERDYDFGAWDSPGVAGIVSALGTAPKGLVGISSGGNKAGDIVRAHGTALYMRDGDEWRAVVSGGYAPATAPAYAQTAPQGGVAELLGAMRKIAENLPGNVPPATQRIIKNELDAAHASIQSALARADSGYAIAAGPEHGQYLRFVHALPEANTVKTIPLVTRGGEDNLRMLREGKVLFALSQADAARAAYEGTGSFAKDGPYSTLRAAGSLYPEPVHVIVRADSPVRWVADLAGRRVVIGPAGSASRATALRVLSAEGLDAKKVQLLDTPLGEALVDLRARKVDAVIQIIGAPADNIRDALTDVPLRLIPLSTRAVAWLSASGNGYFPYIMRRRTYAAQTEEVPTIATAALLLVSPELSDSEVIAVTRYVFIEKRDFASRGSAQGTQVSAKNAKLGLSIPMHVAAAKALEELSPAKK